MPQHLSHLHARKYNLVLSDAVDEVYKLQEVCERGEMRKRLLIIIAGCFYYSG
jgi:hypothetical protein